MLEAGIHEEAQATLNRLQEKHSHLKERLNKAYGYAVFPSIGRAGVVLGGAHGLGEVFEKGEPIGFASMPKIRRTTPATRKATEIIFVIIIGSSGAEISQ